MGRGILLAVVTALACAAAFGCGSGSGSGDGSAMTPQRYQGFLAEVGKEELKAQMSIVQALHAQSVKKLAATLEGFVARQEAIARKLAAADAPSEAEGATKQLAEGFMDTAAASREAIAELGKAKSLDEGLRVIRDAKGPAEAHKEIEEGLRALHEAGYGFSG